MNQEYRNPFFETQARRYQRLEEAIGRKRIKAIQLRLAKLPSELASWEQKGRIHLLSYQQIQGNEWGIFKNYFWWDFALMEMGIGEWAGYSSHAMHSALPLDYAQGSQGIREAIEGGKSQLGKLTILRALKPQKTIDNLLKKWIQKGADLSHLQEVFLDFLIKSAEEINENLGNKTREDLKTNLDDIRRELRRVKQALSGRKSYNWKKSTLWPEIEKLGINKIGTLEHTLRILRAPRRDKHRPEQAHLNRFFTTVADHLHEKTGDYYWSDLDKLATCLFPTIFKRGRESWHQIIRKRVKYHTRPPDPKLEKLREEWKFPIFWERKPTAAEKRKMNRVAKKFRKAGLHVPIIYLPPDIVEAIKGFRKAAEEKTKKK